mmetsp:Transcript_6758/g.21132  ORF Transcript_6758/g.21132 Transcript_6758/m.21132 type:complete len:351 (-) Transcript_6758:2093-3145(-)
MFTHYDQCFRKRAEEAHATLRKYTEEGSDSPIFPVHIAPVASNEETSNGPSREQTSSQRSKRSRDEIKSQSTRVEDSKPKKDLSYRDTSNRVDAACDMRLDRILEPVRQFRKGDRCQAQHCDNNSWYVATVSDVKDRVTVDFGEDEDFARYVSYSPDEFGKKIVNMTFHLSSEYLPKGFEIKIELEDKQRSAKRPKHSAIWLYREAAADEDQEWTTGLRSILSTVCKLKQRKRLKLVMREFKAKVLSCFAPIVLEWEDDRENRAPLAEGTATRPQRRRKTRRILNEDQIECFNLDEQQHPELDEHTLMVTSRFGMDQQLAEPPLFRHLKPEADLSLSRHGISFRAASHGS